MKVPSLSRRTVNVLIASFVVVVIAGLFAFVFPTRALLETRNDRDRMAQDVAKLRAENKELEQKAKSLETDAAVEREARDHFGLVKPGETAYIVEEPAVSSSTSTASSVSAAPASTP